MSAVTLQPRRLWIQSYDTAFEKPHGVSVVGALLRFGQWKFRDLGLAAGVYTFQSGLDRRQPVTRDWGRYGALCCRAWNCCLCAAALTGLRHDTPPGILADALENLQLSQRLASAIRDLFAAGSGLLLSRLKLIPIPWMPTVPVYRADCFRWAEARNSDQGQNENSLDLTGSKT